MAIKLGNMALIDFLTYIFSVTLMLFFVRIPNPPRTEDGHQAKGSLWKEMTFGWHYITARKGLFSLLMFFLAINFLAGIMNPLFTPLILDRWSADVFGYVSTILGVGMLAGTLVMSAWGGGKRKVFTLLGSALLSGLVLSIIVFANTIPFLAIGGFGFMFTIPILNASSQAIWQSKVAPDVQGRVFAVRRAIAWSSQIIAPLFAGPLADRVFKPGMAAGGWLASIFGPFVGVGSNHGIGLLISLLGLLTALAALIAFLFPAIRNVEIDLPDHEIISNQTPLVSTEPAD